MTTPPVPTPDQSLSFQSGGRALHAEVFRPAGLHPERPVPGVLVIHEAFGLTDDIRAIAARFAGAGYAALAVDLFSGRPAAVCMTRLLGGIFLNSLEHQGVQDTRAALGVLRDLPGVDGARLGAVGFCLGGSLAVAMACTDDRLRAVAPYYGFNPRPAGALARACPVVGSFPGRDITRQQGERLRGALEQAQVPHDVKIYPDARHSFANRGPNFDAVASEDAWTRVLEFFAQHVTHGPAGH